MPREKRNAYMREYNKRKTPEQREKNREYQRVYRVKMREVLKARNLARYHANPEVQIERQIKSANSNPVRSMWNMAKRNAMRYGRDFNIETSDIVIPSVCPYLQIPLRFERGRGFQPDVPSIDRIDSSLGYVKGNIQIISRKANTMKNNATREELVSFAKHILNYYDE